MYQCFLAPQIHIKAKGIRRGHFHKRTAVCCGSAVQSLFPIQLLGNVCVLLRLRGISPQILVAPAVAAGDDEPV